MVKCQIEGSNGDEILRIRYPRKANETRNPLKSTSNDLDLRSGRNPCLNISKNSHSNLDEKMKILIYKL